MSNICLRRNLGLCMEILAWQCLLWSFAYPMHKRSARCIDGNMPVSHPNSQYIDLAPTGKRSPRFATHLPFGFECTNKAIKISNRQPCHWRLLAVQCLQSVFPICFLLEVSLPSMRSKACWACRCFRFDIWLQWPSALLAAEFQRIFCLLLSESNLVCHFLWRLPSCWSFRTAVSRHFHQIRTRSILWLRWAGCTLPSDNKGSPTGKSLNMRWVWLPSFMESTFPELTAEHLLCIVIWDVVRKLVSVADEVASNWALTSLTFLRNSTTWAF